MKMSFLRPSTRSPATPAHFRSLREEAFIAELLWGINKRTAHSTFGTIRNGIQEADLTRASEIILRELQTRFYGTDLIEINAHMAHDLSLGWKGFRFKPPR